MSIPTYVRSALVHMCDEVSSPVAAMVKQHLLEGRWDDIANMRVDPHSYSDAHSYFLDSCVVDFLRKTEDLPTTVDRKKVAVESFHKCEQECFNANRFLDRFLLSDNLERDFGIIGSMVEFMRKYMREILGKCPDVVEGRFGPGATYGDKSQCATLPHKMSSHPTFTQNAVYSLVPWSSTKWARVLANSVDKQATCVRGNRFTTVPKDSLKDRGICIEPSINLFYQLGFGQVLKKRLAARGLDLVESQDIHRQVACDASKTGNFATIDLSNASDTICKSLVKLLLPHDWFIQLDDLRSPYSNVDGRWFLLEKFSSMGNGFTFELETAIFLTICQGAAYTRGQTLTPGRDVWVFGDDIIVPTDIAKDVIMLLRYFGLTPNEKKTFLSGPFRESCGGDFFNGVAVRPYFMKAFPNEPQEYIAVANGIRRLGLNNPDSNVHTGLFLRSWFRILDAIPSNIRRCRGPSHLGDLVIHDEPERWSCRTRNSIRYFRVYRPWKHRMVPWGRFGPEVVLACALYGADSNTARPVRVFLDEKSKVQKGGVMPRNSVVSYKLGWTPCS